MLDDPSIDKAYKDCGLFKFENRRDDILLAKENEFHNLNETYWTQGSHDMCVASLKTMSMLPMSTDEEHRGGEFVSITIKRRDYLPGHGRCERQLDYDDCLEKAVFEFYGFYQDARNRWRLRTANRGDTLEESMSQVIDGTIKTGDGVMVVGEWKHPYYLQGQTYGNVMVLSAIRRTPFGYVMVNDGYIAIPVDETPESQASAVTLINRIISVVASVHME